MHAERWQDPPPRGGGMQFAMPTLTPVVKLLLIANGVVFLLTDVLLKGSSSWDGAYHRVMDVFSITPERWVDWFPFVPLWQLATYGFAHGGLGHLVGNLLFLYFLGTMLEAIVGSRRFGVFFLAAVVLAGLCQLSLGLVRGETARILGASGGVLAIVCAIATLRPQTRIIFIIFPITLRTLAILYVAFDLYTVISELKGARTGVASFAHLSGAAFGFAAARYGWIWRDPVAGLEAARERRAETVERDSQAKLDELLAKIHREGIGSLSSREKAFLKKMSRRR